MQKIKIKKEVVKELEKYVEDMKKLRVEHEQGELELYLLRLENILKKSEEAEEIEEIEVDVMEYEAYNKFKQERGL